MSSLPAGTALALFTGLSSAALAVSPLPPCPVTFEAAGDIAPGASRSCVCMPGQLSGAVVGSGRYGPSSWVCSAALHEGKIRNPGDPVTFFRQPACPRLWGSEANGVVSVNWGAPSATYSFGAVPPPCPPPPATGPDVHPCPATLEKRPDWPEGKGFDCSCEWKKRETGSVWGRNIYAIHSDLCSAAQHAGAVKKPGSTVTVFLGGGCAAFSGGSTSVNFVRSSRWGPARRSFAFRLPYPPCPDGTAPTKAPP